jgi:predicted PurR-regulated permease PerM
MAKKLKTAVGGWLLAQGKLAAVTFGVLCAGFLLLRIRHGILWAGLIAILDALPVLGTGIVLVPWSVVAFAQGEPVLAVGLLSTYAVAAVLRSVLEPKLVGRQLGLDPLVTLVALYAGFRLWGIGGMILAPLLTAVVLLMTRKQ